MLLIPLYIIKSHDFSSLVSNLFQLKMNLMLPLHCQLLVNRVLLSSWSNADKVRVGWAHFPMTKLGHKLVEKTCPWPP